MRRILILLVVLTAVIILFFCSYNTASAHQDHTAKVKAYLQSKKSPLSNEEVSLLVKQKHWKLLIAISAIESQYCKRQKYYNCWGIGGDSAYRKYKNFSEAIIDADKLITRWQKKGRWL